MVTFIDDFSKIVWIYIFKAKSKVFAKFLKWRAFIKKESQHEIKVLRLDNRGEYLSKYFDILMKYEGTARSTSTSYIFQQNRVVERTNLSILEMARRMVQF